MANLPPILPSCICLGPIGSGKTMLLKKLKGNEDIDITSTSVPTVGTNITTLQLPNEKEIVVREVGGAMAPLWNQYYQNITRIIYVVDASNLCQIAAAGVLLYTVLAEPQLKQAKVLLVLSKMDVSYRQMRNEALLMLQFARLQREISQSVTVLEASAITGEGLQAIKEWLAGIKPTPPTKKVAS
ncbi:hypothetical protein ONE63_006307 [Megalurothrips usitatus]|uniref:ADP-ribosylation factor-like protein 16 n=1 Tax=Megalurothrips usitatus TaxID=439358 RepID=A0AAV7XSY9_9NEOP|nr:hypothetical protein ONE63_006307 [Megalurothrips usitatus]